MSIVHVAGEVDLTSVAQLRATIRSVMDEGQPHVAVDLSLVTFIDSAGLGALIGGQRQARTFRGSFTLVAPSAPVSRLFELTSLDRVFQIVDHVNDVPVPSVPAT